MSTQAKTVIQAQPKTAEKVSSKGSVLQRTAVNAEPVNEVPSVVHEVLDMPGQPLDPDSKEFMESRFGHDFSGVRIHADDRAAESARAVNARAYTVGRDVVFGTEQYVPGTKEGKRLLAHELTHVVQQQLITPGADLLKIGPDNDSFERVANNTATQVLLSEQLSLSTSGAPLQIQRQVAPPPQVNPANIQFSVNQATYLQFVSNAIQQISGRLVATETLSESIRPALDAMLKKVTWRDEKGVDHGGGSVQYPLPGSPQLILNLQLILDDQLTPPDAGNFSHKGDKDGTVSIRIRNNTTVDELALTLFHEASHMMAWIINRPGSLRIDSPRNPEVRGLTLSRFKTQVKYVRSVLEQLAQSVNPKRKAAGQSTISNVDLDSAADWLLGEVLVRIETEVFRLFSQAQKIRATPGAKVFLGTAQNTEVNLNMVDKYIFDFSQKFLPTDRANLTPQDKSNLAMLAQVLEAFFQFQVSKRFSPSAYLSSSLPRERFQIPLQPLTPPTFGPLPLPPD